jgi:hypothetical protein
MTKLPVWAGILVSATLSAACVSPSEIYNPDHLKTAQAKKIGQICEDVMGLRSTDELVKNESPRDPDPAANTNDYRGCVAALSDSVLESAAAHTEAGADRKCRAKGLQSDTSELADCVLQGVAETPESARLESVKLDVTPFKASEALDPATSETARREQQACAQVGLEPGGTRYANCIHRLAAVLDSQQLNANYEN